MQIIAEVGVNHDGDIVKARELIQVAAEAGADIVKFQTFFASELVTVNAQKARYQKQNKPASETQYEMLKKLELSWDKHAELIALCEQKNIEFLSTAFSLKNIDRLVELGIKRIKIPSGEITNLPYLRHAAKKNLPTILSTGVSNIEEVAAAVKALEEENSAIDLSILQCNTAYPTPIEHVNLKAMTLFKKKFGYSVGFSDHTLGINASLAAAALGASIIEKHFTFSRKQPGPDHAASLEPNELQELIKGVREIELALGMEQKVVTESEQENQVIARRSIVAARNIKQGEKLDEKNLTAKRPGSGISPMRWDEIIGTIAVRDFIQDELIEV